MGESSVVVGALCMCNAGVRWSFILMFITRPCIHLRPTCSEAPTCARPAVPSLPVVEKREEVGVFFHRAAHHQAEHVEEVLHFFRDDAGLNAARQVSIKNTAIGQRLRGHPLARLTHHVDGHLNPWAGCLMNTGDGARVQYGQCG